MNLDFQKRLLGELAQLLVAARQGRLANVATLAGTPLLLHLLEHPLAIALEQVDQDRNEMLADINRKLSPSVDFELLNIARIVGADQLDE